MKRPYIPGFSSPRRKVAPRKRKSRARPASSGYTVQDIERLTRVSKRCLLNWVKRGLVPKPTFRGARTRYTRSQLATILVVKKLRGDFLSIKRIREKLLTMTSADIERVADLVTVLGEKPAPPAETTVIASPATATTEALVEPNLPAAPVPTYPSSKCERITLMPGLELVVGDEPVLRRVAQLIFDQFALRSV